MPRLAYLLGIVLLVVLALPTAVKADSSSLGSQTSNTMVTTINTTTMTVSETKTYYREVTETITLQTSATKTVIPSPNPIDLWKVFNTLLEIISLFGTSPPIIIIIKDQIKVIYYMLIKK